MTLDALPVDGLGRLLRRPLRYDGLLPEQLRLLVTELQRAAG
jgi:hypothetical protein